MCHHCQLSNIFLLLLERLREPGAEGAAGAARRLRLGGPRRAGVPHPRAHAPLQSRLRPGCAPPTLSRSTAPTGPPSPPPASPSTSSTPTTTCTSSSGSPTAPAWRSIRTSPKSKSQETTFKFDFENIFAI